MNKQPSGHFRKSEPMLHQPSYKQQVKMSTTTKLLLAIVSVGLTHSAQAQFSLTGTVYTENFNNLQNSGSNPLNPMTGQINALSGTAFVATKSSGAGTSFNFISDNGSSNAGALLSLGATGSAERSLGTLASGPIVPAFGIQIINNTGSSISSFTLAGVAEQFRVVALWPAP